MPVPAHSERPEGEINTLLGQGSEFEGKLTFEGTVRINGKLSGEIFSDDTLVVGEGAEISAEIDVGVIIDQGVMFEGHCKMENIGQGPRPTTLDGLAAAAGAKSAALPPAKK